MGSPGAIHVIAAWASEAVMIKTTATTAVMGPDVRHEGRQAGAACRRTSARWERLGFTCPAPVARSLHLGRKTIRPETRAGEGQSHPWTGRRQETRTWYFSSLPCTHPIRHLR